MGVEFRRPKSTWNEGYLGESPLYTETDFRRRFGVPRQRFCCILVDMKEKRPEYWGTRKHVNEKHGIESVINVLNCLCLLRTVDAYHSMDNGDKWQKERFVSP